MIFEIDGKEQELKFGLGFVRKLDKAHTVVQDGVEFGMGLQTVYPQLTLRNPVTLAEVITLAAKGATQKKVDEAIEAYAEETGDLEPLFQEVEEKLEESAFTKATVKQMKERMKQNA